VFAEVEGENGGVRGPHGRPGTLLWGEGVIEACDSDQVTTPSRLAWILSAGIVPPRIKRATHWLAFGPPSLASALATTQRGCDHVPA
jgi:hypothetical protein